MKLNKILSAVLAVLMLTSVASVNVFAENTSVIEVATAAELTTALSNETDDSIKITANISGNFTVAKKDTIDLNGYTINNGDSGTTFTVSGSNAVLTVNDSSSTGTILASGNEGGYAIVSTGSEDSGYGSIVVNGGTVKSETSDYALVAYGALTITGGTYINTNSMYCVVPFGTSNIIGGTFREPYALRFLPDGYGTKALDNGYFQVIEVDETSEFAADVSWYADTAASEYEIYTAEQLAGLAELVNVGNSFNGKTIKLTKDIDLNNKLWTPIGKRGKEFKGIFDGTGKTISNLKVDISTNDAALFGCVRREDGAADGIIKDFTLNNADIHGNSYVAAVLGNAFRAVVSDINVTGTIKVKSNTSYVGALVGGSYATIQNCTIDGTNKAVSSVELGGGGHVGIIIGHMGEGIKIENCVARNITGKTPDNTIGAVCGVLLYGAVANNISLENIDLIAPEKVQVEYSGIAFGYDNTSALQSPAKLSNILIKNVNLYKNGILDNSIYGSGSNVGNIITDNIIINNSENENVSHEAKETEVSKPADVTIEITNEAAAITNVDAIYNQVAEQLLEKVAPSDLDTVVIQRKDVFEYIEVTSHKVSINIEPVIVVKKNNEVVEEEKLNTVGTSVKVKIPVPDSFNGKAVVVTHYYSDTHEKIDATANNGIVEIATENGFSQYDVELASITEPVFSTTTDSGYYGSAADVIDSGIIAFNSVLTDNGSTIDSYGMVMYVTGYGEVKLSSGTIDELTQNANKFFATVTGIPQEHFGTYVYAKPYATVGENTYYGDTVKAMVNAAKWLGNE